MALQYPLLEKTYGVSKKKSKINANESKTLNIVEIDTDKIDIQTDVGYKELISDRNRLYRRYFIKHLLVVLALLIGAFLLKNTVSIVLAIIAAILLILLG